jgi:hypothetical protein
MDHELLIYVVPSQGKSVIARKYPEAERPGSKNSGATYPGNKGAISEIYFDKFAAEDWPGMAKIAFHELMHNKLRIGNDMHSDFEINGGAGTHSLASEELDTSSRGMFSYKLTFQNKRAMRRAMAKDVPQRVVAPLKNAEGKST